MYHFAGVVEVGFFEGVEVARNVVRENPGIPVFAGSLPAGGRTHRFELSGLCICEHAEPAGAVGFALSQKTRKRVQLRVISQHLMISAGGHFSRIGRQQFFHRQPKPVNDRIVQIPQPREILVRRKRHNSPAHDESLRCRRQAFLGPKRKLVFEAMVEKLVHPLVGSDVVRCVSADIPADVDAHVGIPTIADNQRR